MAVVDVFEGKQVEQACQKQEYPGLPDKKNVCNGLTEEHLEKSAGKKINDQAKDDTVRPYTKDDNSKDLHHGLLLVICLNHHFKPCPIVLLPALGLHLSQNVGCLDYTISWSGTIWQ